MLKSKLINIVGMTATSVVFTLAMSLFVMFCMDKYLGIDVPLFSAFGSDDETEIETALQYDGYDGVVDIPDGFDWADLEGFDVDIPEEYKDHMWPTVANGFIGEPDGRPLGEPTFSVRTTRSGILYLKNANYGDYNGQGWNAAKEYSNFLYGKYSASYLTGAVMRENNLNVDSLVATSFVDRYATPYYLSIVGENGHIQSSDVYSNGHAGDQYQLSYYSDVGIDWTKLKPARDPELAEYEADYRVFVYENYTYLDKTTEKKLAKIVEREGLDQYDNVYDIINAVAEYITENNAINLEYNHEMDMEANVLVAFLEEYHEGGMQHFASAATVLYRALGVPARYATGHKAYCKANEDTIVLVDNGFAWVEVYIDGIGWKCVDVMEYVKPEGDKVTDENQSLGLPEDFDPTKEEFKVFTTTDQTLYFKLESKGNYTGNSFLPAPEYEKLIEGAYSSVYMPGIIAKNQGLSKQTVRITPISDLSKNNYLVTYYQSLPLSTIDMMVQTSDVYSYGDARNPYDQTFYAIDSWAYYTGTLTQDPTFEAEYRKFVYENYLYMDDETAAFMQKLIADKGLNVLNTKGIMSQLDTVARYISDNSEYSLKYDREMDSSDNVVIAFLKDYKTGICQHYASAATMMFRALGIPARYTVGYAVTPIKNGQVTVKSGDAHAWVEVYLDGFGWRYVEVTFVKDEIKATLTPETLSATYDGKVHKVTGVTGFEAYEAKGYRLEWECSSNTMIGRYETEIISYKIYDPSGNEITNMDFVEITLVPGEMTIKPPTGTVITMEWPEGIDKTPNGDDVLGISYDGETTCVELLWTNKIEWISPVVTLYGYEDFNNYFVFEYDVTYAKEVGYYDCKVTQYVIKYVTGDGEEERILEKYGYNADAKAYGYTIYAADGQEIFYDSYSKAKSKLLFTVDFSDYDNSKGKMNICLKDFTLTPKKETLSWDGNEKKINSDKVGGFDLYREYGFTLEVTGTTCTNIGSYKTEIKTYKIFSPDGEDVTDYIKDKVTVKLEKSRTVITPPTTSNTVTVKVLNEGEHREKWDGKEKSVAFSIVSPSTETFDFDDAFTITVTTTKTVKMGKHNVSVESYVITYKNVLDAQGNPIVLEKYDKKTGYTMYYANGEVVDSQNADDSFVKNTIFNVDYAKYNKCTLYIYYPLSLDLGGVIEADYIGVSQYIVGDEATTDAEAALASAKADIKAAIDNNTLQPANGMEITPVITNNLVKPGTYNAYTLKVMFDSDGDGVKEDCTSYIVWSGSYRKIHIKPIPITITLKAVTFGKNSKKDNFYQNESELYHDDVNALVIESGDGGYLLENYAANPEYKSLLLEGHRIVSATADELYISGSTTAKDVKYSVDSKQIVVVDEQGNNVSEFYSFTVNEGTMTLTKN